MWGSSGLFSLLGLYARWKSSQYFLNRRTLGPQSRPGHFGEEKIVCTCWESNTDSSSSRPSYSHCTDRAIPVVRQCLVPHVRNRAQRSSRPSIMLALRLLDTSDRLRLVWSDWRRPRKTVAAVAFWTRTREPRDTTHLFSPRRSCSRCM
jgi:hypothetical protein